MAITLRRRGAARFTAVMWAFVTLVALVGCQPRTAGPGPTALGDHVVILVSGSASEPLPQLPPAAQEVLVAAANSTNASNGPRGKGSVAVVVAASGDARETLPLTPRRADGNVEHGLQRQNLINANVAAVGETVSAMSMTQTGVDLLEGISQAVRGLDGGVLIIVSNGLSTAGGLDLRELGWDADPIPRRKN